MENLGSLAVLLAFCLAVYAIVGSVVGRLKRNPFLILSAERAVYCVWFLITVASGVLVYALVTGDFRYSYVAQYSNRAMSPAYKFSAWWGGQEGSLLLWSWLLATYSAVAIFTNRRKLRDVMPYVTAILMTTQTFFLILNAFVVSPFRMLAADGAITAVPDGNGLNPLLQYPMMRIHPPMLYLGYVGMVVPFAFAMGSLITRQKGEAWIHTTRRWSLVTWLFQGVGVLMGASWAYAALGWGGYWAWDPVENASLLPWLSSTAYLILDRLDYLKSEAQLESVVSRESSFLFNNLILLASCFAVLWGTLFPIISEAVTGDKISLDAPFFNRVNIPIGL